MKRNLFILIIAILLLSACASAPKNVRTSESGAPAIGVGAPELQKNAGAPAAAPGIAGPVQNSGTNPAQERIVIQIADLAIVVKDPQAKMVEISALAKRLGGFVVSSNMSQVNLGDNAQVPQGDISIRVPAKDLDNALNEIKANTVEIQSENRTGQDVTDKYVDLQSQLKAKQAAADKLYEILQKADNTTDTLAIFTQLTQVQSDIEVLKGQINYYEQAAALSAISVRLIAEETIKPIVIAGWQPQGVARDAVQALINFLQGFTSFLIWLVILIIPMSVILIVLLALVWRLLRWFWKKVFPRKTPPPANTPAKAE